MVSRSSKAVAARKRALAAAKRVRRRKDGSREIKYSQELAQEICARIGRGAVWSRISGTDGMPEYSTLYRWRDKYPEFAEAWALAKVAGNEFRADEVLAVSEEATRETIQEDRLLVGSLKWHVARADSLAAKSNDWVSGRRRLVIRIREFERAWRADGTPYVREITASEDGDHLATGDGAE
jgi:transposase-like protein